MKRTLLTLSLVAILGLWTSGTASAAGRSLDVFEQSNAWACEGGAGLPPNHCINVKSQGNTGVLMVFAPDERWPQESISFDPKADARPCPHDPAADADGSWWEVFPGAYVCHHRP